MRTQKLKSRAEIGRSLKHMYREQDTPNADPERLNQNNYLNSYRDQDWYKSLKKLSAAERKEQLRKTGVEHGLQRYDSLLPNKVRKNAVHGIEVLVTASPEVLQKWPKDKQLQYFLAAHDWLNKRLSGPGTIIGSAVHNDETTPHLSVIYMPLKDGRLNARHYIGGHRDRMSELQDEFHAEVGHKFALDRGVKRSRARHISIREYYGKLVNVMTATRERMNELSQQRQRKRQQKRRRDLGDDLGW